MIDPTVRHRWSTSFSRATVPARACASHGAAFILRLVSLLLSAPTDARAQAVSVDQAAIRRFVTAAIRADGVPGLSVVVVSRDGTVYAEGFGTTGSEGAPVTPDTPFALGSMSKSFTALAIMQLVEDGRVDLDATVQQYLPSFATASPEAGRITVRQLLAHTSGIPTNAARAEQDGRTLADHVTVLRGVTLASAPGAAHEYASPNYQILGRIVEVMSGESFGAYVAHHVFAPLGMRRSYVDADAASSVGLASGHQMMFGMVVERDLPFESDRLPTAALMSSANDLGRFMRMQLRGGELDGIRVASDLSVAQMHRPQVQAEGFAYAMGWRLSNIGGAAAVHHGGILPNYRGKMVMLPGRGLAVVVLTNVSTLIGSPTSHRVADGIAAIISGQPPPASPGLPLRWILVGVGIGMAAITTLQLRGLARAIRATRSVGSAAKEVGFAAALLFGIPLFTGIGWPELWRQAPDMVAWMILAATLGVATGMLRLRTGNLHSRPK